MIQPKSVGSLVQTMLKSSQFVYKYGKIRRVVNNHDNLIRNGVPAKTGLLGLKTLPLGDFYRPELIVTQRGGQDDDPNRYMNYAVTADAILEFLSNNRNLLKEDEETGKEIEFQQLDTKSEDLPKMYTESNIESLSRFDGEIIDYDDEDTNADGLVYGITLNRSMKRITVVFRGTVGGSDILADAKFWRNSEHFADLGRDVKVHTGFSGYLFKELEGEGRTKYDRIVAALKDVYNNDLPKDERDGYKVVVSGHSLGGALANLLSFTLSVREGDGDCPLFRYIRAVTFAAPVVGDSNYDKVFQEQESKNKLHILRVSNEGDWVPTNPSPFQYTQNGVNMHVQGSDQEMELRYGNKKSLLSQFNFDPVDKHMLLKYEDRIFQDDENKQPNLDILDDSFDEVYQSVLGSK